MANKEAVIAGIKRGVTRAFNDAYGYAGVAEMPGRIIINSGNGGDDLIITIEDKSKPEKDMNNEH